MAAGQGTSFLEEGDPSISAVTAEAATAPALVCAPMAKKSPQPAASSTSKRGAYSVKVPNLSATVDLSTVPISALFSPRSLDILRTAQKAHSSMGVTIDEFLEGVILAMPEELQYDVFSDDIINLIEDTFEIKSIEELGNILVMDRSSEVAKLVREGVLELAPVAFVDLLEEHLATARQRARRAALKRHQREKEAARKAKLAEELRAKENALVRALIPFSAGGFSLYDPSVHACPCMHGSGPQGP